MEITGRPQANADSFKNEGKFATPELKEQGQDWQKEKGA